MDPVLSRELRQRMRGPRAGIVITLYLTILSLIVWTLYEGVSRVEQSFSGPEPEQIAGLGRSVFQTLLFCVLLLVCFIVPGQTAGAIAGERERQTLVPLQITLLRSRSILIGKLLASLAFVLLLIVATLPLVGVAFILGGVELGEVVRATAMLVVVAAFLACLSVLCSSITRRTQGATVLAYGLVLALVLGTFMVFGAQVAFSGDEERDDAVKNLLVLQVNPFMAMADVLDSRADVVSGGSSFSPFTPMQALLRERQERESGDEVMFEAEGDMQVPVAVPGPDRPVRGLNRVPFVLFSLAAYAGLGVGALALAARRIDLPKASA